MKRYIKYILFALMIVVSVCAFAACGKIPQAEDSNQPIQLSAPTNFRIVGENLYWDEVENADYYVLQLNGSERNLTTNSYTIVDNGQNQDIIIKVKASSYNKQYLKSEWAEFSCTYEAVEPATKSLKYTLLEDKSGYEVARGYKDPNTGLEGRVVIPDYYNGLPVKKIADDAFELMSLNKNPITGKDCNTVMKSIRLPAYLEEIGSSAFTDCLALEEIVIPDSVTFIGRSAFNGCKKLSKVTLSASLEEISEYCFAWTGITGIEIPQSVSIIEDLAFTSCKKLAEIKLPDNLEKIGSMIFYESAWYNSQPDGFVIIREDILYGYKGEMAEGTVIDKLPSQIKYIAGGAFRNCKQLVSIDLTGIKLLGGSIFLDCSSLTNVILPSEISEIPEKTFSICTSLKSIVIPESVVKTGVGAFINCGALSEIYYCGTQEQWNKITFGNKDDKFNEVDNYALKKATKYFYSESEPADGGTYWHYVDGKPVIWTKEN